MPGARGVLKVLFVVTTVALPRVGGAQTQLATSHLSSDEQFEALLSPAQVALVAEGRIGDRAGTGAFELDLGRAKASPAATAQHEWRSGVAEPFSLEYNSAAGRAKFTLAGATLEFSPDALVGDLFIRALAAEPGSYVLVDHLVLDGERVGDRASSTDPTGLDILGVSGAGLSDGFLLTGTATLAWHGHAPSASGLAFQIIAGAAQHGGPLANEAATWGEIKALYR